MNYGNVEWKYAYGTEKMYAQNFRFLRSEEQHEVSDESKPMREMLRHVCTYLIFEASNGLLLKTNSLGGLSLINPSDGAGRALCVGVSRGHATPRAHS